MPGLLGTVTFIELCTASFSPGSLHFLLRTITPLTLLGGPPPALASPRLRLGGSTQPKSRSD